MKRSLKRYNILALCLLFSLNACSSLLGTQELQRAEKKEVQDVLNRNEMSSVIASGFYAISERALEPVSVEELALEGMRGLATLDPEISLMEKGGYLHLSYKGQEISVMQTPLPHDSESWADVVYDALAVYWSHSSDLRQTTSERVYEAVFDAALSKLDIFSRYAGSDQAQENRDHREGYGGVGFSVKQDDMGFYIDQVEKKSPASNAQIKTGMRLLSIDGQNISAFSLSDVEEHLRGTIESALVLEIIDEGHQEKRSVTLWRELIIEHTVKSQYDKGVLKVTISGFNELTAKELKQVIQDYSLVYGRGFKGIILDLRSNPGGLLKRAVQVVDLFVNSGVIISTKGRHPDSIESYEATIGDVSQGRPIVILMNSRSASAAEIVAASLQDHNRSIIVGSSSYGKGTVQAIQHLPNDGEITLTWSRLIAPSGYAFHGLGVRPSICTSGLDQDAHLTNLQESEGLDVRHDWQTVEIEDLSRRKALRHTCTPVDSKKRIDEEIAFKLLSNKALYKRFLGFKTIATVIP